MEAGLTKEVCIN